jgi:hypothetical protein
MSDKRDVYENDTAGNRNSDAGKGSSATTFPPGEKPFKQKGVRRGTGYKHVPGAGENPAKLD